MVLEIPLYNCLHPLLLKDKKVEKLKSDYGAIHQRPRNRNDHVLNNILQSLEKINLLNMETEHSNNNLYQNYDESQEGKSNTDVNDLLDLINLNDNNRQINYDKQHEHNLHNYIPDNQNELDVIKQYNRLINSGQISNDYIKLLNSENNNHHDRYNKHRFNLVQNDNSDSNSNDYIKSLNSENIDLNLDNSDVAKFLKYYNTLNEYKSPEYASNNNDNIDTNVYSKVLLILDPKMDFQRQDMREISQLVSSLLTKSDVNGKSKLNSNLGKKQKRFKGFVIRDNPWARRRIESNESYRKDRSRERNYNQKRSRNDFHSMSRTAKPYIRQHNIYDGD